MKAVIMAGGMGIRLRPFTYVQPKPLLPVANISPIEYLIRDMKRHGFDQILISVNYLSEKFDVCSRFEKKYGISVKLIRETKKMGTIGSLSLMRDFLDDPFILINGDLFTEPPYKRMLKSYEAKGASMVVGIKKHDYFSPYGVIVKNDDNTLIKITEKPLRTDWISAGVYLLDPKKIDLIKNTPMDIPTFIQNIQKEGDIVITCDIGEKWLDIGNIEDFEKAESTISDWK